MHAAPTTWLIRLLWFTLPLTLGDLVADWVAERSGPVGWAAIVMAWLVWAGGLLAALITVPWALLAMRVLMPLAVAAAAAAAVDVTPGPLGWAGLVATAVAAVAALSAEVGYDYINGGSYGDEARFPLRPPAALLLGPIGAVWAVTALPVPIGVLTLAAEQWVAGAVVTAAGAGAAWWGVRVLSRLLGRWCVFVPAGITLVDDLALAEPTLMRATDIAAVGPAPADTSALDLSAGATGLILQIDLHTATGFLPAAPRGGVTEEVQATSVLLAPSRPGALIRRARERGLGAAASA